jgi:hypothetical protein
MRTVINSCAELGEYFSYFILQWYFSLSIIRFFESSGRRFVVKSRQRPDMLLEVVHIRDVHLFKGSESSLTLLVAFLFSTCGCIALIVSVS